MEKHRIQWIDAMRGFTMFLVVVGHLFAFSFGYQGSTIIHSLFTTFRMPLFFFISGYISYKASEFWTFRNYKKRLLKKAQVQLIPTVFFFILFFVTMGIDPWEKFLSKGFERYWFTFVLFEMFTVYFSVGALARKLSISEFFILIPIVICCFFGLSYEYEYSKPCRILSLENFVTYLPYFIFGSFCRKCQKRFMSLIMADWTKTVLFLSFLILFIVIHRFPDVTTACCRILDINIVVRWIGLLFVLSYFVSKQQFFAEDGKLSRVMQYVGRHTLEIYMMHYFFLPQLPVMNQYFGENQNVLLELITACSISACIVAMCLLCGKIIRNSQFLGHYLFAK